MRLKQNKLFFLYKKDNLQDKNIYFTFDDGPNPYATQSILDVLDKHRIKAAFFLVGNNIKKYPRIAKEINKRGHIIGNHSFSHSMFFATWPSKIQKLQARKVEELLGGIGIAPCLYFRPPNAICNRRTLQALGDYNIVGVNQWICDNLIFSAKSIVSQALKSVRGRGGGIVVLHDGVHPWITSTRYILAKALDMLIPELSAKGYNFHTLDSIKYSNVLISPFMKDS
jgi:peptidoglycan/xylan/chitin deacetylase (PgdA/CDA1 family)